jgi:hypothetical protein
MSSVSDRRAASRADVLANCSDREVDACLNSLTIQIVGGTRSLIEELLGEAYAASLPKSPGVSVLTAHNGSWQATSWQPNRPLGPLVLAGQILEDLLADMREFYRSGAWYAERGIPYRRGYLLHTSSATATSRRPPRTKSPLKRRLPKSR